MLEPRGGARLALEAGMHDPLTREHLDGDVAVKACVPGRPDGAERPASEALGQAVSAHHHGRRLLGHVHGRNLARAHVLKVFALVALVPAQWAVDFRICTRACEVAAAVELSLLLKM
jgi:hypothetical protein